MGVHQPAVVDAPTGHGDDGQRPGQARDGVHAGAEHLGAEAPACVERRRALQTSERLVVADLAEDAAVAGRREDRAAEQVPQPGDHLGETSAGEEDRHQLSLHLVAALEEGEHLPDLVGWQLPPEAGRIVGNFTHARDGTAAVGSAG